jgi:protein-S-isoprenylcysteine O-methyltransferase Ste14
VLWIVSIGTLLFFSAGTTDWPNACLCMIGMPLLLGSWLGLLVLPLILSALSVRIFIEEAALRKGLPGYGDYIARVRYRLIPGVC